MAVAVLDRKPPVPHCSAACWLAPRKACSMPTYDAEVDSSADTSHALMLRLVGPDRRVLDVGCATGYLGEALMARGCRVSGVELDPEAALRAKEVLDEVLVADLETANLVDHFGAGSFDVVVFGDVLEHVRDPERLLRSAVGLLAEKGSIVISIPNVAHAALRLALLQGQWVYSDRGLLDRTHVQFFTRATLLDLVRNAGLVAVDVRSTTAGTFATEIAIDATNLPDGVVEWVEDQPDAAVYQFVLRAIKNDADGAVEVLRLRYDTAEETLRKTTKELAARRAEVEALSATVARLGSRVSVAEDDFHTLAGTRSFRALRAPRRVYGWVRGLRQQ
ncbi:class I SAM-dependent methyltransferase [Pengzhenrongella phosphoraccumulans]|uniref:class I SAM-dependent methyltransferase n=1 Tax=Pengzhenrongella phosphoraccumulans TaxID=3114394 RepID=UPI00388D7822